MIKKIKNNLERSVALFEIVLMILSVLTFSYLIGSEIEIIDASDKFVNIPNTAAQEAARLGKEAAEKIKLETIASHIPRSNPIPGAATPKVGTSTAAEIAKAAAGGAELGPTPVGDILTTPATQKWWQIAWEGTKKVVGQAAVNALIGYGLYMATSYISQLAGWGKTKSEELGSDIGWGYFLGSTLAAIIAQTPLANVGWIGALVNPIGGGLFGGLISVSWLGIAGIIGGGIVFILKYTETDIKIITYSCNPWFPEKGGEHCEECNKGEFPCSEYRCESLGMGCELINKGEEEEMCVWLNEDDILPPEISSWDVPLNKNLFEYVPGKATSPGDKGVEIKYKETDDGCVPPFTRFEYGITLNEPGACKYTINDRTKNFDEMGDTWLSNSYYVYNHSILAIHGGNSELESEGIIIPNGGNYEVYVRCEDKNGNTNDGNFVFKYCVSDEPDIEPPRIEVTNPMNTMPIKEGQDSIDIEVYTNKPSDCKWSHNNENYDIMPETMSCASNITEIGANMLYKCTTTLTGLKDSTENKFYFNCKSYPLKQGTEQESERKTMANNYIYTLMGTKALVIDSVTPNNTIVRDSTESVKVILDVKTSSGSDKGNSWCYVKESSAESYTLFLSDATKSNYQHTQELWLTEGNHNYDIKCCDLGGNCDTESISFSVETDTEAPKVIRIYKEGSELKLVTNEKAECVYDTTSCNYVFENGVKVSSVDGVRHNIGWSTQDTLYIKCKDDFEGQPSAETCTIIIRPSDTF